MESHKYIVMLLLMNRYDEALVEIECSGVPFAELFRYINIAHKLHNKQRLTALLFKIADDLRR